MAFTDFRASFVSVTPRFRDTALLELDLASAASGKASDIARSSVAEIELAVSQADDDFRQQAYDAALDGFKHAQGLIYRLLHPDFDVSAWVGTRLASGLEVGTVSEQSILAASSRLGSLLRPSSSAATSVLALGASAPAAEATRAFTVTGFHQASSAEAQLESVGHQALALMLDGRPDEAVPLMRAALATASSSADASPHAVASTRLNLASALLQQGDAAGAADVAKQAADGFTAAKDTVGVAQALHSQAVAAHVQGDQAMSDRLLAQAQLTLGQNRAAAPAAVPPAGPVASPPAVHSPIGPLRRVIGEALLPNAQVEVAASPVLRSIAVTPGLAAAAAAAVNSTAGLLARDPAILAPILENDVQTVSVRLPGRSDGSATLALPDAGATAAQAQSWNVGLLVGARIVQLPISAAAPPSAADIVSAIYRDRINATSLIDLIVRPVDPPSTAYYLTHLYSLVLPMRIGDCYHELGHYPEAEASYVAASGYSFLNTTIEGTALWIRIAKNAYEWGNVRYKATDLDGAKAQYGKIIGDAGTVPTSVLYTTASLNVPADVARNLITHLADRPLAAVQWEIARYVLAASGLLAQIAAGLDYYGLALSPIHTFEYLQSVARGLAQEANQAERDYVNFKSRQEAEAGTRRDLESAGAMAAAEVEGRLAQLQSAQADVAAAQIASALAVKRRDDAVTQRDGYASSSWTQIWAQAAATALGSGSDANFAEISGLADQLDRGERISGDHGKLAAAETYRAGRRTRTYELAKMADNIAELNAAIPEAAAQVTSAVSRAQAAEVAWQAAMQRAAMATASLAAFDANVFTPDAWAAMAEVMRDVSRDYLWHAIRIAKLMERAFNFENDTDLRVIKDDYGRAVVHASGADAMLFGGDGLLADIESFTFVAITTKLRKTSRIKDVLSLAAGFPAHFEQFRKTGLLAFETDLPEFDALHPGFYGQRIEAVELEFVGLLPESGLNGTLAAGGVTRFRHRDGGVGSRVQGVDTMALSNFNLRNDVFVYQTDTGVRGLFQGLGLGCTWQLHLPKRSNDFDFRRIVDVRLVTYYTATFDPALRTSVLARVPRAGELEAVRDFNLRYDFPEAWFGFYRTGVAAFSLDTVRLPANQTSFAVNSVQVRVVTQAGVDPLGIGLTIAAPGGLSATATTDANGVVDLGAALPALTGKTPVGAWSIAVTGGASLTDAGAVKLARVQSLQFGLDYGYAFPPEAL